MMSLTYRALDAGRVTSCTTCFSVTCSCRASDATARVAHPASSYSRARRVHSDEYASSQSRTTRVNFEAMCSRSISTQCSPGSGVPDMSAAACQRSASQSFITSEVTTDGGPRLPLTLEVAGRPADRRISVEEDVFTTLCRGEALVAFSTSLSRRAVLKVLNTFLRSSRLRGDENLRRLSPATSIKLKSRRNEITKATLAGMVTLPHRDFV